MPVHEKRDTTLKVDTLSLHSDPRVTALRCVSVLAHNVCARRPARFSPGRSLVASPTASPVDLCRLLCDAVCLSCGLFVWARRCVPCPRAIGWRLLQRSWTAWLSSARSAATSGRSWWRKSAHIFEWQLAVGRSGPLSSKSSMRWSQAGRILTVLEDGMPVVDEGYS